MIAVPRRIASGWGERLISGGVPDIPDTHDHRRDTIVITAGYMLWVLQRVFLGTLPDKWSGLTDMDGRETVMLWSLAGIVIFLGIYPVPMLDLMNSSMKHLAEFMQRAGAATILGVG